MKEPVRIVSDLHLGHRLSRLTRVAALRPLLAGAGTVIFNGDTWQELTGAVAGRAAEMLDELQTLCAQEACVPVFLSGNHDPGWPGPGWVELAGGRVIVTHGYEAVMVRWLQEQGLEAGAFRTEYGDDVLMVLL